MISTLTARSKLHYIAMSDGGGTVMWSTILALMVLTTEPPPDFTWIERASDPDGGRVFVCPEARAGAVFEPMRGGVMPAVAPFWFGPQELDPLRPGVRVTKSTDGETSVVFVVDGHGLLRVYRAWAVKPGEAAKKLALRTVGELLLAKLLAASSQMGALRAAREVVSTETDQRRFEVGASGCEAMMWRGRSSCPSARRVSETPSSRVGGMIHIRECSLGDGRRVRQVDDGEAILEIELSRPQRVVSEWGGESPGRDIRKGCTLAESDPAARELTTMFVVGGFNALTRVLFTARATDVPTYP